MNITDVLPTITVTKTPDTGSVAEPGGNVTFTVTVTNNSTVESVTITALSDTDFSWTGDADCQVGTVLAANGGSCEFEETEFIAGNGGDTHENTFTAWADDDDGNTASDNDDASVNINAAGIDIEKTGVLDDGDDDVATPGDVITYTFVVTNTGDVALDNVAITELTFGGLTLNCTWPGTSGELGVGEHVDCTADYPISQAEIDAGTVGENCADADGTTVPEGNDVTDQDCTEVQIPKDPSIDVRKGPDNAESDEGPDATNVPLGLDHTFWITVTNTGNVTLMNVIITDAVLPACDRDSNAIAALATMAPGDSVTYSCDATNITDQIDNEAMATATGSTVQDMDPSTVFVISPTAQIGDTVYQDTNGNGTQNAGEPGIEGAKVELLVGDSVVDDTLTDSDGKYLFTALAVGDYKVVLDLSTVDGDLTTAGSFDVSLSDAEVYLDADFGVQPILPVTGIDADRIGLFGLMMLGLGFLLVVLSERRRREN